MGTSSENGTQPIYRLSLPYLLLAPQQNIGTVLKLSDNR